MTSAAKSALSASSSALRPAVGSPIHRRAGGVVVVADRRLGGLGRLGELHARVGERLAEEVLALLLLVRRVGAHREQAAAAGQPPNSSSNTTVRTVFGCRWPGGRWVGSHGPSRDNETALAPMQCEAAETSAGANVSGGGRAGAAGSGTGSRSRGTASARRRSRATWPTRSRCWRGTGGFRVSYAVRPANTTTAAQVFHEAEASLCTKMFTMPGDDDSEEADDEEAAPGRVRSFWSPCRRSTARRRCRVR